MTATSAEANVVFTPSSVSTTFGNDAQLALVSSPSGAEPTAVVSLSQARNMLEGSPSPDGVSDNGDGAAPTRDVRVPVSRNSLAAIVNGGVKLPTGVEQQLFVVKAN